MKHIAVSIYFIRLRLSLALYKRRAGSLWRPPNSRPRANQPSCHSLPGSGAPLAQRRLLPFTQLVHLQPLLDQQARPDPDPQICTYSPHEIQTHVQRGPKCSLCVYPMFMLNQLLPLSVFIPLFRDVFFFSPALSTFCKFKKITSMWLINAKGVGSVYLHQEKGKWKN